LRRNSPGDRKLRLLAAACWRRYERHSRSRAAWAGPDASERRAEELAGLSNREVKLALQELGFAAAHDGGGR
jgi:hypothetical protein